MVSVHPQIEYPESDGLPLADNTIQFRYITTIQGGLDALYADDPNVFIAGDLLWYPVEGDNQTRMAPDVMVALGRPKGDRRSYRQWEENNIAPQVVFEIASRSNTLKELEEKKLKFYNRYGVQEYYLFDPDRVKLKGWIRQPQGELLPIASMQNWVSPLLKVRFELTEAGELQLYTPTGERFATYVEAIARVRNTVLELEQKDLELEQEQERSQEIQEALQREREQLQQERERNQQLEQAQRKAIAPLAAMGLDAEAIANILSLPVETVQDYLQ
ncbi:Uma2 family endonuclease [Roseofilum capinflatum]|uniref:Uma2 family endonuclease n=1 Tax=Roseofilum capinflatum BLCC-M114 TaxID=3022440 RepID=A0ABT7BBH7_9CYAN|nr:Uma2 family endonuclease [Roseofilum capinflatum]MDJ1176538.1 Uma2 family endonuclease [Roseofilum capinflatum BLCC-M114]